MSHTGCLSECVIGSDRSWWASLGPAEGPIDVVKYINKYIYINISVCQLNVMCLFRTVKGCGNLDEMVSLHIEYDVFCEIRSRVAAITLLLEMNSTIYDASCLEDQRGSNVFC